MVGVEGPVTRPDLAAAVLLGGTVVLAACESSPGSEAGYTVVDSAGIRIVESLEPARDGEAVRIEEEPLIRIGREDEGPYQLAAVVDGTLLAGGRVAVSDALTRDVRVFDASGRHVATFGGPGEGPGEFGIPTVLAEYRGDSLAAFDGRLFRTTIFSLMSGGHRTVRNHVEGNYVVFGAGRGGVLLLYSPGGGYRPDLEPGAQWVSTDIVAMAPDGESSRVVATLPDRWRRVASDGNAPMPQPLLYAVQDVTGDGFYWATPDRYEIRFYDMDGRLERIMRRPVEPRPVEPAMIERFIEARVERARQTQGEGAARAFRARYEEESFGEHLPLFQAAFVDDEERLWVGSSEWPAQEPSGTWSVFSPEGRWLRDLDAPEGVRLLDANGSVVLGVWRDSLDVPHIQLHRLIDESEGT